MALCVDVNAGRCIACLPVLLQQFLCSFEGSREGVDAEVGGDSALSPAEQSGHQAGQLLALLGELREARLKNKEILATFLPNGRSRKELRMRGRGRRKRVQGLRS